MTFGTLLFCVSPSAGLAERISSARLETILDCAVNRDPKTLPTAAFRDDALVFSYWFDPREKLEFGWRSDQVHFIFWTRSPTDYYLNFSLAEEDAASKVYFSNFGIVEWVDGMLDVKDLNGGIWTHDHVKSLLPKIAASGRIRRERKSVRPTNAWCFSPFHEEGLPPAPAAKPKR